MNKYNAWIQYINNKILWYINSIYNEYMQYK